MGEICDASYLCQWEALERQSVAQIGLLPHLTNEARERFQGPDQLRDEFDAWLGEAPKDPAQMTAQEREELELFELLGVGRG